MIYWLNGGESSAQRVIYYKWKYIMEECMKIFVFSHEVTLKTAQIANLQPLLREEMLTEVCLPKMYSKFKPDLKILHSCLYFLVAVDKNLSLSKCPTFREKCLESISSYYIKHRMTFELFQYGYLSSLILSIPLDKGLHILYFLVYSRLASKPYINSLILKVEKKECAAAKKKTFYKSEQEVSIQSKERDSRHFTIFVQSDQFESDLLKKQLKKILNPANDLKKMTKKIENKRFFNLKKLYPDEGEFKDDNSHFRSAGTSRIYQVPVKVSANQNSSIINRLKMQSGLAEVDQNSLKKTEMRRQKFNEWFDGCERYYEELYKTDNKSTKKMKSSVKQLSQEFSKQNIISYYRNQKHPFEYYQQITSQIKNKNEQLDSIRNECLHHVFGKITPLSHKQVAYYRGISLTKSSLRTEGKYENKDSAKTQKAFYTKRQSKDNAEQVCKAQSAQTQQCINRIQNVDKSLNGETQYIQNPGPGIITRKNVQMGEEQGQLTLFNKKSKNQFKLQKYKQEYRQFLKTQMFERVKQS